MLIDKKYLTIAYITALNSPDPSTQNGAVLVSAKKILGSACNDFPAGVKSSKERLQRPAKYSFIEHAERAAISDTVRRGNGHLLKDAIMYCPWAACTDCARAIIAFGIRQLVVDSRMREQHVDRWAQSITDAWTMLEEANVTIDFIDGPFGVRIRQNEQLLDL